MGHSGGIGIGHTVRDDHQLNLFQRPLYQVGVRHGDHWVGRHNPEEFDFATSRGLKQLDGLQAWLFCQLWGLPETFQPFPLRSGKIHMSRQLIRQPADLAAAHRIGLSGDGKRAATGFANFPGRKMDIDDGVGFVAAAATLVNAHRIGGDCPRTVGKPLKAGFQCHSVEIAPGGQLIQALACFTGSDDGLLEAFGMLADEIRIKVVVLGQVGQ